RIRRAVYFECPTQYGSPAVGESLPVTDAPAPLTPDEAARLVDFARACKAAARAVTLYPSGHPAIATTLGRIVHVTSPASLPQPLRITVLPDSLLLDGRAAPRPDPAIGELAVLLHDHLVGELTVHASGDVEAWRRFLLLLARTPVTIRAEGGIARVWTMMAGRHVELREIDYAEVLRERKQGQAADWDTVVANCLQGDVMLGLLSQGGGLGSLHEDTSHIVSAVISRMSESTIARFVAHNVVENTPIDRVVQAFQTLVRDGEQRQRMLALAHNDVAASPLGQTEGFEQVWNHVAERLLTSYSDESYVSDAYGRELSRARTQAVQVEQTSDDPPERLTGWLSTIATSALRALDLTLLLDLLRLEQSDEKWTDLMVPVVSLLEDLLLVGDFEAAAELL